MDESVEQRNHAVTRRKPKSPTARSRASVRQGVVEGADRDADRCDCAILWSRSSHHIVLGMGIPME